jgi:hypothetical protein
MEENIGRSNPGERIRAREASYEPRVDFSKARERDQPSALGPIADHHERRLRFLPCHVLDHVVDTFARDEPRDAHREPLFWPVFAMRGDERAHIGHRNRTRLDSRDRFHAQSGVARDRAHEVIAQRVRDEAPNGGLLGDSFHDDAPHRSGKREQKAHVAAVGDDLELDAKSEAKRKRRRDAPVRDHPIHLRPLHTCPEARELAGHVPYSPRPLPQACRDARPPERISSGRVNDNIVTLAFERARLRPHEVSGGIIFAFRIAGGDDDDAHALFSQKCARGRNVSPARHIESLLSLSGDGVHRVDKQPHWIAARN